MYKVKYILELVGEEETESLDNLRDELLSFSENWDSPPKVEIKKFEVIK